MLLACGGAEAMSKKSALTVELMNVGRFIELYHEQEGEYPKTWNDLERVTPNLDSTFSILKPTQRMVLLSPPLELPRRYGGGMAFVMTREPFRPKSWKWPIVGTPHEYLKEPSYAAIVSMDGGVFLRRVPPADIRSLFAAEGLPLPEPSGLGSFPHEREFVVRRSLGWIAIAGLSIWVIWRVTRRPRNQRSERAVGWNGGQAL